MSYTLVYSTKEDKRKRNILSHVPHPLNLLANKRNSEDVRQAKSRLTISSWGRYRYTPSKEYQKLLEKFKKRETILG